MPMPLSRVCITIAPLLALLLLCLFSSLLLSANSQYRCKVLACRSTRKRAGGIVSEGREDRATTAIVPIPVRGAVEVTMMEGPA